MSGSELGELLEARSLDQPLDELTPAERRRRVLEEWRTRELVRAERMRDVRRRVPGRVLRLVERMLGPRP